MDDQVMSLHQIGINARMLSADVQKQEANRIYEDVVSPNGSIRVSHYSSSFKINKQPKQQKQQKLKKQQKNTHHKKIN